MRRKKVETADKTPEKGIKVVKPKTKGQAEYIRTIVENDITICHGDAGCGKAQPLYCKILTPDGWMKMGDAKIGDVVCNPDGTSSNIIGVYPQGELDIYEITFKDGSSTHCSEEHLWEIHHYAWEPKIKTTAEIIEMMKRKIYKRRIGTIVNKPLEFCNTKKLELDPYMLGLLIGDGGLTTCCRFSTEDEELLSSITELAKKYECRIQKLHGKYDYGIRGIKKCKNPIINILRNFGLIGKRSEDKFIPAHYLLSSIEDRWALLQGLMDTDGTAEITGGVSYSTSSPQLVEDVKFLINSLGGITNVGVKTPFYTSKTGEKINGLLNYNINIRIPNRENLFRLLRKRERVSCNYQYQNTLKRRIINIEKIGKSECQCIKVSHPNELYITDDFIVTHNTHIATMLACQHLCEGKVKKILLTRPIVAASIKSLGALPGDVREKIDPYLIPLIEELTKYFGSKYEVEKMIRDGVIELAPLELMRGRTFDDTFMILDEAANCTFEQLKMFITRIGENSRMVINGDTDQSDLKEGPVGLLKFIEKLDRVTGIGISQLGPQDIVRNEIIKRILGALK